MRFPRFVPFVICLTLSTFSLFAQSPNGNINGQVSDPSSAAVVGAEIVAVNDVTGVQYTTRSNSEGIYVLPNLPPGPYRVQVSKVGFKTLIKPDITLNVQDSLSINFTLLVGAFHEIVTVQGGAPLVDTESATVSTVVDRQFAENLPMNGRSFQTLIDLTPGVVTTAPNPGDGGQFSVNGQRASSNYWMLDGVSANIGISATPSPGNGLSGALGAFSTLGGTNSLVSVDAMQEFRIQTSTYAPEFGRTPGAQISIITRSGENQVQGTAFDYLRNDLFDANNWFNTSVTPALPKAEERQNDFGGTVSGPLVKDRSFFFFSYEGFRLRLPHTTLTTVPDQEARHNAVGTMSPYLNAYPLDTRQPDLGNGVAQFNASYSDPASLDAYSLRIDQRFGDRLGLFGRYNYSPSFLTSRGGSAEALSVLTPTRIVIETLTVGSTWGATTSIANDFRFNYSRTNSSSYSELDHFGGAVPLPSLNFPSPFTAADSSLVVGLFALKGSALAAGRSQQSLQRQFNLVDGVSLQKGKHTFKLGVDFRRLSPVDRPPLYSQVPFFLDMSSAEAGNPALTRVSSNNAANFLFENLGAYAQDTWHTRPDITLTFGLRWDVDFAPSTLSGPRLPAVTGYDLKDLSQLSLAPSGTPPFRTRFGNLAPRIGIAYELRNRPDFQTVVRSGFGVFYDLASSEIGNLVHSGGYPFSALNVTPGGTFPLDSASAAPPTISPQSLQDCCGSLAVADPGLQLPYTLQWSLAIEQGLVNQSVTATYIGSSGRRLLQTAYVFAPNPNFYAAQLVGNTAASNYNALQLQWQHHLSHGLEFISSFTWSHSIDDGSAGSAFVGSNTFVPSLGASLNRASSDFDIRHAVSAGLTYEIPSAERSSQARHILGGWSTENFFIASSAPPIEVDYGAFQQGALFGSLTSVRPDPVPGVSFYLSRPDCLVSLGPPCAGGKGLNPAAFVSPPIDAITGNPVRQGNLGRNALRGFGLVQWDFAVHRQFPIRDRVKLEFRAEIFNIMNHPNFAQPVGDLGSPQSLNPQFGQSQAVLAQGLGGSQYGGNAGSGSLSSLYQIGGPRSAQFALKLSF